MKGLAVVLAALAACHHTPSWDEAWDATRTCIIPKDLADRDPRDALALRPPIELACKLDELRTRVPADATALAAAVDRLLAAESGVSYSDDTGEHVVDSGVQRFANAVRDVDDLARALHHLPPLHASRIPLAVIGPVLPIAGARTSSRDFIEDATQDHELAFGVDGGDAIVAGPGAVRVVAPPATGHYPEGGARRIVDDGTTLVAFVRDGTTAAIQTSADRGATWTVAQKLADDAELVASSSRTLDAIGGGTWTRVDHTGAVQPAVAVPGATPPQQFWACAADVLWTSDAGHILWFDRAGHHGSYDAKVHGPWSCAGGAMVAPAEVGGHIRCTPAGCAAPDTTYGLVDLTATGLAHAGIADRIVVLSRTDKPTIRLRLPDGIAPIGFAVWADIPTLLVTDPDERFHLVTLATP